MIVSVAFYWTNMDFLKVVSNLFFNENWFASDEPMELYYLSRHFRRSSLISRAVRHGLLTNIKSFHLQPHSKAPIQNRLPIDCSAWFDVFQNSITLTHAKKELLPTHLISKQTGFAFISARWHSLKLNSVEAKKQQKKKLRIFGSQYFCILSFYC